MLRRMQVFRSKGNFVKGGAIGTAGRAILASGELWEAAIEGKGRGRVVSDSVSV